MKPMLAAKLEDPHALTYPVLVSPKLDGIRCLIVNGQPVSRNLKVIPNEVVRDMLSGLPAMDGELIVGEPRGPGVFNRTSSGVMSRDGAPKFVYHVFDALTSAPMPFDRRLELAKSYANACGKWVQPVAHKLIHGAAGLLEYESQMLLAGYEGIMIRSLNGLYKHGRATLREGTLLKLKRFTDDEAVVLGFEELEANLNEQTRDELGRAKRSSHKAGKIRADTLGALVVQSVTSGQEFNVGTGFTEMERDNIWAERGTDRSILGKVIKYRYQEAGVKDKPRFPVFLGVRDDADR